MVKWIGTELRWNKYGEISHRIHTHVHMVKWWGGEMNWNRSMVKWVWWNGAQNTHTCLHGEIEIKWNGAASKDVAVAHGPFRQSARHHSETMFSSAGDTASDELKKQNSPPSLEGTKKPTAVETAVEGEYNHFTITMWTSVCILCTISPYLFHHSSVPIQFTNSPFHHVNMGVYSMRHLAIFVSPYLCTNPFHSLTISPFHNYSIISKQRDVKKRHYISELLDYFDPMRRMIMIVRKM